MADQVLSHDVRDEAARRMRAVIASFQDDLDGLPTLSEFLEVISSAPPSGSEAIDFSHGAGRFRAKIIDGHQLAGGTSRVAELNDATFVDASALLEFIGNSILAVRGSAATQNDLAAVILELLRASDVSFDDVAGSSVVDVEVEMPKRSAKPTPGDVVAIPTGSEYRMAVVIARNRFGTALGLLGQRSDVPKLDKKSLQTHPRRILYTDDQQIQNGAWAVIDHDVQLLSAFPSEPEIYHNPDPIFPNAQVGEHGAAELPSGVLRQLTEEEAQEVGLADNSYRQVYLSTHLQQLLADGSL